LEKDYDAVCDRNSENETDLEKYRLRVRDLEGECHSIKDYAAQCLKKYEKLDYENNELRELKSRVEDD